MLGNFSMVKLCMKGGKTNFIKIEIPENHKEFSLR